MHFQAKTASVFQSLLGILIFTLENQVNFFFFEHTLFLFCLSLNYFLWLFMNIPWNYTVKSQMLSSEQKICKKPHLLAAPATDLKLQTTPVVLKLILLIFAYVIKISMHFEPLLKICYEILEVAVCENDWFSEKLLCSFAHRQRPCVNSSAKL